MYFKELIENHPELVQDRHSLSFGKDRLPAAIASGFSRSGVVMLKGALPAAALEKCGEAFRRFVQSLPANQSEADGGSWYSPWTVRWDDCYPAAAVLSAVIKSWAWDVVEEICRSSSIAVLLKFCTARHNVDMALGVGAHQDAKVVAADVPLSIWIPLQEIVPGLMSGLGFVAQDPRRLLPTLPHDDVGADYVLADPGLLWIPHYVLGDLTIHSKFSPHFTTGYGTLTDRFSLEIRAMPKAAAPAAHLDPVLHVARRNGIPTIVEASSSAGSGARPFLECDGFRPTA